MSYGEECTARGGGGGHSGTEGGRTFVTYFAEEGVFFLRPPHVRMSLTIHEIYAALTPSDSRSDSGLTSLLPPLAAAKQAEDYKILS